MNKDEFHMDFSNEEIFECIYKRFKNIYDIKFYNEKEEEISGESKEKIYMVSFDDNEDLAIRFLKSETSIYIFDEQIMLIDELTKGTYTSSDTDYNIVFEGNLICKTHSEILDFMANIIECFENATGVEMNEIEVPQENKYKRYNYYEPHHYILNVSNGNEIRQHKVFENITINY